MERLPSPYTKSRDFSIILFMVISMGAHFGMVLLLGGKPDVPIEPSTVELELEGEPDEPPPLGTNATETGPPPEPEPEPTPPPIPEDTPPPPIVEDDFKVPEEAPKPTPKPAAPKPKATPAQASATPAPRNYNPKAPPGQIAGIDSPKAVAGGRGEVKTKSGGKSDFISKPRMVVPYNLRQRLAGVKASARAIITYSGGRITDVEIVSSSGNSSLDAAMIRHVKSNYKVKAGSQGVVPLPIAIGL